MKVNCILSPDTPDNQNAISGHEVVHSLGLDTGGADGNGHVNAPGNLMQPGLNMQDPSQNSALTEQQLQQILQHPANTLVEEKK
jgi:hypothetical protein